MSKWITNWPRGGSGKWGLCSPALAAQIAAEGSGGQHTCQVRLVDDCTRIGRLILHTPVWAQTLAQRAPAVALARRLDPMAHYQAQRAAAAA